VKRAAAFALLIVATAAPAAAQRFRPDLPPARPGVDYVETICTGGIDGRYEQTRLLSTGEAQKVTRREPMASAPVPRADVAAIMRDLDRARFERRTVPAMPPRIMDGINCTLTRRKGGRPHSVTLRPEARDVPAYRDLVTIIGKIDAVARRAMVATVRPVGMR